MSQQNTQKPDKKQKKTQNGIILSGSKGNPDKIQIRHFLDFMHRVCERVARSHQNE